MTRFLGERGSLLPVTAGLLATLAFAFLAASLAGGLVAARIEANAAAHSLAVEAAASAMAGQSACGLLVAQAAVAITSCTDSGTDVHVVVRLSVDNPLRDSVVGESRVGYGGGNSWVTES